jgi:hypothetical protein
MKPIHRLRFWTMGILLAGCILIGTIYKMVNNLETTPEIPQYDGGWRGVVNQRDSVARSELKYLMHRQYIPDDLLDSPIRDKFSFHGDAWYIDTISCWDSPYEAVIWDDFIGWLNVIYFLEENAIRCGNATYQMHPEGMRILTFDPFKMPQDSTGGYGIYFRYSPQGSNK